MFDYSFIKNIMEDARIILTIRTINLISTIVCKGFKCSGNKYSDLIKYLKEKKLIKNGGEVIIYLMEETGWIEQDRV